MARTFRQFIRKEITARTERLFRFSLFSSINCYQRLMHLYFVISLQLAVKTSCINISGSFYKVHRTVDVFDTELSPKVAKVFACLKGRDFVYLCIYLLLLLLLYLLNG